MRDVIIYPGTFDPFHRGHKEAIKSVQNADCARKRNHEFVVLLQNNRFKNSHMFMLDFRKTLIEDMLDDSSLKIMSTEHESFYDWLCENYEFEDTNISVVIGDDVLSSISNWHHFAKLNELVTFVVAQRTMTYISILDASGILNNRKVALASGFCVGEDLPLISSTSIRKDIVTMIKEY